MNSLKLLSFLSLLIFTVFISCVEPIKEHSAIPPGIWRAEFKVESGLPLIAGELTESSESRLKDITRGVLPINFEVIYNNEGDFYIEFINGEERIVVDEIYFGRDIKTAKDTIRIEFPEFDTYIEGIFQENVIEGSWNVNYRDQYKVPFVAYHGKAHRFTNLIKEPASDLTGKWKVQFSFDSEDAYPAIGEFIQEGQKLTGSFRTETGDYRFLSGVVYGNEVFLSCFDGAHAFLFEARIQEDESLIGTFRSGRHFKTNWIASRNDTFELSDAYELTYLINGATQINFEFESTENEIISLTDEAFKGKVKLVNIFGTWCPNCKDETIFLREYLEEQQRDEIAIISIGFEKYKDKDKSLEILRRYKDKMGMTWPVVYGGYWDKKIAVESLPMLNQIISYPTLIFIDKTNTVRKIHTGFNGPATSQYDQFKSDFKQIVDQLLSE